jgi:cobalt/nickel transport system permease protein/cobalt/nickel transport protein
MDKLLRNLLIVLAVMIVAVPIGLLAVGTAYGEWGAEELEGLVGYIPQGLESVSNTWTAPIPDYALPSLGETFLNLSLAYWASAIIGVILSGGLLILLGKAITSRNSKNNGQL